MSAENDEPVVLKTFANGVLTLTLNRPAARNALSLALVRELRTTLQGFIDDENARVAVITGAGTCFCAGLDLKDFSAPDSPRGEVGELIRWLPTIAKPVIAAVNGAAMTGGLELMLACDFALASERARFGDTHLKIGALSGSGMNSRLPQAVGLRWAKQMVFGCEPIDAATALRIGLINEIVPEAELMTRAHALAHNIASRDAGLVAIAKDTLNRGAEGTLRDAVRIEAEALAARKAQGAMAWKT